MYGTMPRSGAGIFAPTLLRQERLRNVKVQRLFSGDEVRLSGKRRAIHASFKLPGQ
jgi:hypothetical protein